MKKLITAILVLVILVSMVVLPAAAATVEPRYPIAVCPYCGRGTTYMGNATYYCAYCNLYF